MTTLVDLIDGPGERFDGNPDLDDESDWDGNDADEGAISADSPSFDFPRLLWTLIMQ